MNDLRTAAQQALEALFEINWSNNSQWQSKRAESVIPALRSALAQQQEQEPVAHYYAKHLAIAIWEKHYKDTAPDWTPLPDLMGVLTQIDNMAVGLAPPRREAQQGQEPVEIKPPNPEGATQCIVRWFAETPAGWVGAWDREALARFTAHPPRREWQSLTDEEMHGLYRRAGLEAYYPLMSVELYTQAVARAIEAALKERNT